LFSCKIFFEDGCKDNSFFRAYAGLSTCRSEGDFSFGYVNDFYNGKKSHVKKKLLKILP
jgi:hypothetical protein